MEFETPNMVELTKIVEVDFYSANEISVIMCGYITNYDCMYKTLNNVGQPCCSSLRISVNVDQLSFYSNSHIRTIFVPS